LFGTLALLGEVVALADGLGLSRDVTFDVLAATPLAGPAKRRRPSIEDGDYAKRFALALARKDSQLIIDAAEEAGVDVRVLQAARAWLADAEEAGLGERDYSTVLAKIIGTD
jgi:3-hydroxyisobutyrate dehydrogenase/2-hydroxy-3-oxopropionate reductase